MENNPTNWVDPQGRQAGFAFSPAEPLFRISGSSILEGLKDGYRRLQEKMEQDEKKLFPNLSDEDRKELQELALGMALGTGGSSKDLYEVASEKTAKDIAKQTERDLGKEARRAFHDMKECGNRTLQKLKDDARYLYEQAGKKIPSWLKK